MDTARLLNLLRCYVLGEGPQPGGLLAAGAQPGRRGLVAVGEVLPGHSGHRGVHRHVARRRGRLNEKKKNRLSFIRGRTDNMELNRVAYITTGQENDHQMSGDY